MKYLLGITVGVALLGGGWYLIQEQSHHEDHQHEEDHHHEEDEHNAHGHTETLEAKESVRADGSFTIATSFYPLQFALERIAGDNAEIINIGAGRDPHDFQPSVQDIRILIEADLVVLQGADFEPWGDAVIAQLKDEEVPVVQVTSPLTLREGGVHHDEHADSHEDEHETVDDHTDTPMDEHDAHEAEDRHDHAHGQFDPHTWLDPTLFSETVEHLAEVLTTLDPEMSEQYAANSAALQKELAELNTSYQTRLASCALDEVITSHEAFGYVGARYDFAIHSIVGLSTQDQPSAVTLTTLREEAEEGIGAILLEENNIAAYGDTLARETGLATLSINPIAYIIPEGADYLSLMQTNLDTFATALECNE